MQGIQPESTAREFIPTAGIASLKIALVAGFSIDAGTFIYPLTISLRNMVHKRLGIAAARTVVILKGLVTLASLPGIYLVKEPQPARRAP